MSKNFEFHTPGIGHVGSYQVSGIPFISSSIVVPSSAGSAFKLELPTVSQNITVVNHGPEKIWLAFSVTGISASSGRRLEIEASSSFTYNWRIVDAYLISDTTTPSSATFLAGITGIHRKDCPANWVSSSYVNQGI